MVFLYCSYLPRTSHHFCQLSNHVLCNHHVNVIQYVYALQTEKSSSSRREQTIQTILERILNMKHETIRIDAKKKWFTDLSNEEFLVEIKHVSNMRESIGQILCYETSMSTIKRKKLIVLFGQVESCDELLIFVATCKQLQISVCHVRTDHLLSLYCSLNQDGLLQ